LKIVNLCIVCGEAMDFIGEIFVDFRGEVIEGACPEDAVSYLDLNIFFRRKQLFAQGSLSCIMDIREKNISEETLLFILQYSS
jgi:hypothetical protein